MLLRSWRRLCVCAAVVLVLVGGCSDGGEPARETAVPAVTETVTQTVSPTAEPSTSEAPSEPPSSAASSAAPSGDLVPDIDGPVVALGQVSSPSGNIWCSLEYGIECSVRENDYPPLPRPAECDLDWADNQFYAGADVGTRGICRGDVTFEGRPPALAYGSTSVLEGRACQSTEEAMTCWDTASRHGFRLSRASYDLF